MDSINFKDFMIKLALSGDVEYFQDNNKEENKTESTGCKKCEKHLEKCSRINRDTLKNICAESLKAEKKCECKNQQDFNKRLIKEIGELRIYLTKVMCLLNDIEEKIYTENKKADTSKLCQCAKKRLTDDEIIKLFKNEI